MPDSIADFPWVVVGAGVVGAAVAAELSRRSGPGLVIERWSQPAQETTSRNSGVLHAGIHHPSDWLKTRTCVAGRRMIYELADRHGIPVQRCGKLVVAAGDEDELVLHKTLERGLASGVEGLRLIDTADLESREPGVRGRTALLSPESGIVDPHALTDFFLAEARGLGSDFAFGTTLIGAEKVAAGFRLTLADADAGDGAEPTTCITEVVVNSSGLDADRVAWLFGIDTASEGYDLTWAKGDYWALGSGFPGGQRHLIYPVPPADLGGLGIHLTLDLGGGLRLGPDVEWLPGRQLDFQVRLERRDRFFEAASRYLRGLEIEHLAPDMVGIRPKLSGPGDPARDFLVNHEADRGLPGLVNMVGIESPGLTASPALAQLVAGLLT